MLVKLVALPTLAAMDARDSLSSLLRQPTFT
jgi:hypothetical protein